MTASSGSSSAKRASSCFSTTRSMLSLSIHCTGNVNQLPGHAGIGCCWHVVVADSYYLFGHQYDITAEGCYSNPANLMNSMGNGSWNGSMMKNEQSPLCELNTYCMWMVPHSPSTACWTYVHRPAAYLGNFLLDMTGGDGASTRMLYTHSIWR